MRVSGIEWTGVDLHLTLDAFLDSQLEEDNLKGLKMNSNMDILS